MGEPTTYTELAALRARVAMLEAVQTRGRERRRVAWGRWLGLAIIAMLALLPTALAASDRFGDVPDGAFYHDDANAIAAAGITLGCGGGNYCPNAFVTRGEMAAFLARTAGLGGNAPVVNAATAITATNAITAATALAVANGAVTPAGLSATGSTTGQVLTSTGGGVAWHDLPAAGGVAPTIRTGTGNVAAGGGVSGTALANCEMGEMVVGGGHSIAPNVTSVSTLASYPSTATQWTVTLANGTGTQFTITAYALCVPVAP